ncbi:2-phosphosulfolactate phosphatase [Nocardioides sp. T2.26MG-1]|uniref:2-phosphosulfolactate phosphatase n=1 Tax=Nocardioides sp. T2.26MG-1 TaxID=3041166 RepID=UPI0024775C59|nr:2-phosphosulfolactate phosphatase [Nocardioides sp. T2.26MG-1]CAI9402240.1 putative 2-phosphosulfolactate phosphatase [Nocardioides sp. T2.26MG-1]
MQHIGAHSQSAYRVRMEWGATGAAAMAEGADVAVVVDVLSFTTTLSVAVERGMTVYPFRWKDERAAAYAAERDAVLATGRSARGGVSLSPVSVRAAAGVERLVLPSPNGSSIAFGLAEAGVRVVGASLRNASAVARWLPDGATVAVVAAGERWPDGTLRPAVEDLWGAGAVIAALAGLGASGLSPEARVAEQAFRAVEPRLAEELPDCASGRELVEMGFAGDVEVAAGLDASDVVPLLVGEAFVAAGCRPRPA